MGRTCFVPNCNAGYKSCKESISLFSPPKDDTFLKIWQKNISRADKVLSAKDSVCERHFESHYIIKEWNNGTTVIPLDKPRLTKDAVPTIFPGCPLYLTKIKQKRRLLIKNAEPKKSVKRRRINDDNEKEHQKYKKIGPDVITDVENNSVVMMPSVDHCMSKTSEMTTLTNSLEVFDTYKHREDKDSDEESFHLPLDDDESEAKYQDAVVNGKETEDEILNKFESTAAANVEPIDSKLEERLLDDEEERKSSINENGVDKIPELNSNDAQSASENCDDVESKNENEEKHCDVNDKKSIEEDSVADKKSIEEDSVAECTSKSEKCSTDLNDHNKTENSDSQASTTAEAVNDENIENNAANEEKLETDKVEDNAIVANSSDKANDTNEHNEVPKVDVVEPAGVSQSEDNSTLDESSDKRKENNILSEIDSVMQSIDDGNLNMNEKLSENNTDKDDTTKEIHHPVAESENEVDKCENSDDLKNQNDDSEDLFDISVIRDAAEDNAESAYNEAHPEEGRIDDSEDYDERNDEKMEDDSNSDKANNLEEEEEDDIDMEKHEDQLKHDDVEIEETNLKDTVSDGESDSGNRTDLGQVDKQVEDNKDSTDSVKQSAKECRLDEITGRLVDGEAPQPDVLVDQDSLNEKPVDVDSEDADRRKSLKRTNSDEAESRVAKKSRTEETLDSTIKSDKPKEKIPLTTLLSLSEFMKNKKPNRRMTMYDLEEFSMQKLCEAIAHKSDLGDLKHQLKLQEQLIETMRKEIQQLTKQARDLEIVNKKLLNDLKQQQQNATQKPLTPLKITRSVGLQVKFTPAYDAYVKRRQSSAAASTQKSQGQAASRGPRSNSNSASQVNRQVSATQKTQTLPKPNTPLLSQALQQNRRTVSNDTTNKNTPQAIRPRVVDPKNGASSASVIDLTDEDDKKDKNKTVSPPKVTAQKSITVPLRTTPVRMNAPQSIRLTTSQGKGSPITSVVTSSAPQVMYVVQSSPQNVLTSPLGPKAVVVNFQSANGVLTSTLNGSAVSVIPKQASTIQLKAVASPKTLPNNKIVKMSSMPTKHPAPLPPPPVVRVSLDKPLKPIPPKPHLTIRKTDTGIILQWKMPYELDMYEVIASYQLYAYQETSALPSTDMWRKVGDVKALALPMACTLTQFADKNKYYFAVRPVDIHKRIGVFSDPEEISL